MIEELVAALQALLDGATAENRDLTDEEQARFKDLDKQIRAKQATAEMQKRAATYAAPTNTRLMAVTPKAEDAEVRAFESYVRNGDVAEYRAQSKGTDSAGGYLVPDVWRDKLVERQKAYGGFLANVERINTNGGEKILWPTLDDTANAGVITAEGAAFSSGADLVFGEASLDVYKYTSSGASNLPLKVSVELLQDSAYSIESLVEKAFRTRIARKEATDALVGTGSGMPKGILNGTADIAMPSGNVFTYAVMLSIESALDPAYRANAKWVMNSSVWSGMRALVDGSGRPLIQSSIDGISGQPALHLLGYPVILDNSAPAASGDAVNFLAFGDFEQAYVWRTVKGLYLLTDPYTYMGNGQVGYVAYERAGGTVQDRNAYVLVSTFDTP